MTKRQEEIDIVGLGEDSAIYGECKYRNETVGIEILEKLIDRCHCIPRKQKFYILFAKTGFSNTLKKRAESDSSIRLFTLDDLYR